jgi:uncharacterized membrane protein
MLGDRRLRRDLERWQQSGWVTEAGARAIRAEIEAASSHLSLANVLAILAAVLLCFGAMTFVAANWQDMPRLARLGLLTALLWGSYGAAGWLQRRHLDGFAEAAILLGCGIFGASIMLIAQMYHIEGNPPDAVLWWGIGTALAALALRSNPAFCLAILLAGLWGAWETVMRGAVFWPYLLAWGALFAGLGFTTRWRPGLHLLALSLSGFVVTLGYLLSDGHRHDAVFLMGLATIAILVLAGPQIDRFLPVSRPGLVYGFLIAFAGLFNMQFIEGIWSGWPENPFRAANGMPLVGLAVISLALILGATFWGARAGHKPLTWIAYAAFCAELLGVYFRTLGFLLDTSLFFLFAGLLVAGLAFLAFHLHRRQIAAPED